MLDTTTTDLIAGLIRFRRLIARGLDPESAFCMAHDPIADAPLRVLDVCDSISREIAQIKDSIDAPIA